MNKKSKVPATLLTLILVALTMFLACSKDEPSISEAINDNEITTTFSKDPNIQQRESEKPPYLPEVELIELIGKNTSVGLQLKSDIESFSFFNLNYDSIERIKLSGIDSEVFTIPLTNGKDELVVFRNNKMISFVIGSEEKLSNGNTRFTLKNFKNEIFYQLDQDSNDKFGNFVINDDNKHGFFQLTEDTNIVNTTSARNQNCLHLVNFNSCMQCAWDQCSSSWVCGAALALKPVPIIAAAATLCAASAVLSIH